MAGPREYASRVATLGGVVLPVRIKAEAAFIGKEPDAHA